jgi:hypothetical protein
LIDPILQTHLEQLGPAYRVFDRLSGPHQREAAAALIDFLHSEQFRIPEWFADPPDALPCLRAAVKAAHPDRKCIAFLIERFPGWLSAVAPGSRPAFEEELPNMAPAVFDLNDAGMRLVLEVASADPRALKHIAAYAMTTAEAIRAIAAIAHSAVAHHRIDLLESLVAAFPAAKMEESRDAERLLPAIASAAAAAGPAWPQLLAAAITLTRLDVSSACGTCKSLPKAIARVSDPAAYLADVDSILGAIGLRAIGLCLKTLPAWHSIHPVENVRRFVQVACAASREFGVLSGMAFLERKTDAARRLLP